MKIIPVMDLLDGKVVHGVAGKRKEYKPIENSIITKSNEPFEVARDFEKKLGLNTFYIADLNLIQKTKNMDINRRQIQKIFLNTNHKLMVDGGCTDIDDVIKILAMGVNQVIIGTETLASLSNLKEIANRVSSNRIILSIDLLDGKLLTNIELLRNQSINDIIGIFDSFSLHAIIILELRKVGSQTGPMNKSLQAALKMNPSTDIYTGGGVRDIQDIIALKENGISGALIATAFHKGKITKEDLELLG